MREVTERDLRAPEYKEGKPSDYEFEEDGTIARKDRWETGIRKIVDILGLEDRTDIHGRPVNWKIDDVVEDVKRLHQKSVTKTVGRPYER